MMVFTTCWQLCVQARLKLRMLQDGVACLDFSLCIPGPPISKTHGTA